jgi:predicted Zn-dependent protease
VKQFGFVQRTFGFGILLLVLLSHGVAQAQRPARGKTPKKKVEKQVDPPPTVPTSPLDTALDLGEDFLNAAARLLGGDPYAAFRNARYSNDGLMSETDEARLGAFIDKDVRRHLRVTPTGQARLEQIGQRLVAASGRPALKFRFYVINDKALNAFAIPGGYVYATSGLLSVANDDELASVIGHEIGHVTARHGLKSVKHAQTIGQLAELLGGVAGTAGNDAKQFSAFAANIIGTGVLANHGREDEREADYLGLRFMAKAGFKPEAMITMFQRLQKMKDAEPGLLEAILNDHPDVDERIANTAYEIKLLRDGK